MDSDTELCELSAEFVFAVLLSSMLGFLSLPLSWGFLGSASTVGAFRVGLLLSLTSASLGPN